MKRVFVLGALLIFISSSLVFSNNLSSLDYFHADESNWIRVSIFSFDTFFIEKNYQADGWQESFRTFGFQNPQMGKFVIGASLYFRNFRDFDGVIAWNHDKDIAWHVAQGLAPTAEERYAARLPICLLASGTVTLVGLLTMFALYQMLFNKVLVLLGGVTSSVLFAAHPIVWQLSHRAMPDIPAAFFSTLAICLTLATLLLFQKGLFKRSLVVSAVGAVAVGLAISTKLNALLSWGAVVLILVVVSATWWLSGKMGEPKGRRCFLAYFFLQLSVPWLIFWGSNPFLYKNGIANLQKMIEFGQRIANRRAQLPNAALYTVGDKLKAFASLGFGSLSSLFHGNSTVDVLVFIIGFAVLGGTVVRLLKQKDLRTGAFFTAVLLLLWASVLGVGVLLWTPLSWGRYYMPWLPATAVFQGTGLIFLVSWVFRKVAGKQEAQQGLLRNT